MVVCLFPRCEGIRGLCVEFWMHVEVVLFRSGFAYGESGLWNSLKETYRLPESTELVQLVSIGWP